MKIKPREVRKSDHDKYENQTTRSLKNIPSEVGKSNSNNTNMNYTDLNNTNVESNHINQSLDTSVSFVSMPKKIDEIEESHILAEYDSMREQIKANIEYPILCERCDYRLVDEIVEVMLDTVLSTAETINVNSNHIPQAIVKKKLLDIDLDLVEYVVMSIKRVNKPIHNMRAYILSSLLNASSTFNHFWEAEVRKDMPYV